MNNLFISVNAVFPIIVFIALGALAVKTDYLDEKTCSKLSKFSFGLLIPINLFKIIINSDFSASEYYVKILYYVLTYIALCVAVVYLVNVFVKGKKQVASIAQALMRTNTNLFGLTMMMNLYGADNIGATALLVACMVPITNIGAVIILKTNDGSKLSVKSLLKSVVTNPLIIATFAGLLCLMLGISFNEIISKSLNNVASIASPVAFIALGGSLKLDGLKENFGVLNIVCLIKLVILPLIVIVPAYLIGVRGIEIMNLYMLFGTPTAISSYQMAKNMNADYELSGQLVFSTTLYSLFMTIIWIYGFLSFGILS